MKKNLKWMGSYETLRFDTPDGDIDKGQFCRWKEKFLVRNHPKNNKQFELVDTLDVTGMEEVFIAEEKGAYYDTFALPNGRRFRVSSTRDKYNGLRKVKNFPQPSREVDDIEIEKITKDDHLWQ